MVVDLALAPVNVAALAAPTRPALRYFGGKWRLAPWIISHFPAHRTYIEPYGGGASVLLRKPRAWGEVYNDLDGEVVNLFSVLRDAGEQLRAAIALTPFARVEFEEAHAPADDRVERARRMVVRSFLGFGGGSVVRLDQSTGFRACANLQGMHPANTWANWPDQVPALVERLRGVVIENRPALEVMRQHDAPGALFYLDPPYVHETRGMAHGYLFEMRASDHQVNAAHGASSRGRGSDIGV